MKNSTFFALFAILILLNIPLHSEKKRQINYEYLQTIEVGKTPLKAFYDKDISTVTVLCYGVDVNFNGVFEDGDESPSIWNVELDEKLNPIATKIFDLDFNSLSFPYSPLRPAFDSLNGFIYIPLAGKIVVYDTRKLEIDNSKTIILNTNSICLMPDNKHLAVTIPNTNGSEGELGIINIESKSLITTFYAGLNVQEAICYPTNTDNGITTAIAVLTVGNFGSDSSMITFGGISKDFIWKQDSILIGNTANNLFYFKDKIYSAINMDHQIFSLDLNTKKYFKFSTGTTGYSGPREINSRMNKLFVTTYSGDVRIFNLETGELENQIDYVDKYESIEFINDDICIVTSPTDQGYTAHNVVYIFKESEPEGGPPARVDVEVGMKPIWAFFEPDKMILHVLCQGLDKNGNGIKESGDINPSYWTIKGDATNLYQNMLAELPFNSLEFPLNPVVDTKNGYFYLPMSGLVIAYNINNIMQNFIAVDFKVDYLDIIDNYILITPNKGNSNKDTVFVYDITQQKIINKFYSGKNTKMAIYCNNVVLDGEAQPAIITLTDIDNKNSQVNFIKFYDAEKTIIDSVIIDYATSISYSNNDVVANNLTFLTYINTEKEVLKVDRTVDLCTGNAKVNDVLQLEELVVSALDNGSVKISEFGVRGHSMLSKGNISSFINAKKGPVQIVAATNIKELNGDASNIVSVWGNWLSSVENINDGIVNSISTYPNPAKDVTTISINNQTEIVGNINIKLNSINGNNISEFSFPSNEIKNMKLDVRNLAVGVYMIFIELNGKIYNTKLNIVR